MGFAGHAVCAKTAGVATDKAPASCAPRTNAVRRVKESVCVMTISSKS
jgi:hypothetical protein